MTDPTIHASAVLIGARAVLIRGPSGSGKSQLVWGVLQAAAAGMLKFARLVADDRAHVEARHGRLLVRPAWNLAGLLELRGVGIRTMAFEPVAVVGLVADLAAESGRLPATGDAQATVEGIQLPCLQLMQPERTRRAVAAHGGPLATLLSYLHSQP